jgi:hypothetical protein
MLSVIMLSAAMMNVVMLSGVALQNDTQPNCAMQDNIALQHSTK